MDDDWGSEDEWGPPSESGSSPFSSVLDEFEEEEEQEKRLEKIKPASGDSRAFSLVKDALAGGLQSAQQMYAILGNELGNKGHSRASRALMREGRRILEDAYGLDAVRLTVPRSSSAYARVQPPDMDRTNEGAYTGYPLTVHKFDRKQRRLFGKGTETYYTPGTTFTGPDAVQKALEVHIEELGFEIARLDREYTRLLKSRSVSADVARRTKRLLANRDALIAERDHYAGVLARVEGGPTVEPAEQIASPSAGDPKQVAAQMAAAGKSYADIRAHLMDNGEMTAREATKLARALTKKS